MIIDERMSAFIDSLDSGNPAWLNEIEKYALDTQVPIIRRSMQSLLKFLLTYTRPKSILEVGTAIGFSALLMSEYAPADCHITTIEKYEKRIPIAKDNFRKAGREDRITLLEGPLDNGNIRLDDDGVSGRIDFGIGRTASRDGLVDDRIGRYFGHHGIEPLACIYCDIFNLHLIV